MAQVSFPEQLITADLDLEKLNDEELFAAGTSHFAASDFAQAARHFTRIVDFHAASKHRRAALYNAGLSLEKLERWEEARQNFAELADPAHGSGDAVDATFRLAEVLYHLGRHGEAVPLLQVVASRSELTWAQRIEARVQQGICELEAGQPEQAERTLRDALSSWQALADPDLVDDFFPAQAQFFLGEIYRTHFAAVALDGNMSTAKLAQELEYKSELLLSAQGHYLRTIRIGHGYWATAAGQRIGQLYEDMYAHLVDAPAPAELSEDEREVYRTELRKRIRVLLGKAITVYERTLEAAERIGASSPFVEQTRASLQRMKSLFLAEADAEDEPSKATAAPHVGPRS